VSEFRTRLVTHAAADRLLDTLLTELRTQGLIRPRGQQRTDSTHVLAAIRLLNRLECVQRTNGLPVDVQAAVWGSILPATWSFMLAAHVRGLGTAWTVLHLTYEEAAAQVLGISYSQVMQTALIPVAYTQGTDFRPAPRLPLDSMVHWDRW
jgi:nitroreductase